MKLLSDSRRRRKFIIWLEGLGARWAAGPGGARGKTEAATEAADSGSAAREPSRQPRRTGPGGPGCAKLSATEREGQGAGPQIAPPRAAEPAPPPTRRLRTPHLAARLASLRTWSWREAGLLQPVRDSVGRAWEPVLLTKNRQKGAERLYRLSIGEERAMSYPRWRFRNCPQSLRVEKRC